MNTAQDCIRAGRAKSGAPRNLNARRRMTPTSIVIPIPESIRRITDSSDRALAWQFFVFFARFEYALKRHPRYLKAGSGDAEPNWDKFGSEHNSIFHPASTPNLDSAVSYFLSQPPRKQLRKDSVMSWSEPQFHDGKEPLLIWLHDDRRFLGLCRR